MRKRGPDRAVSEAQAPGILASHPFANNAKGWGTLMLYVIQRCNWNGWATRRCQLKDPPSRKEREKGRAPTFMCGERVGQPPTLVAETGFRQPIKSNRANCYCKD